MGTEAVQSKEAAPLHPALFDYACLDAVVRPALCLPPHTGPPDAFSLALAVGLLFQRFVNACSAAHVDSTEPWMHALAFADQVLSAPFQSPLPVGGAHSTEPTRTAQWTGFAPNAEKLEETPGPPSQHARLFANPRNPSLSAEPVIRKHSIHDPLLSAPSDESTSNRKTLKPTVAPSKELPRARPSPPQNASTPPRRALEVEHAGPSTSRNAPSLPALDDLRPHIRAVLAAPDIDWETFNVPGVRRRLVERGIPGVTAQWVRENKARLKPIIEEEFDAFAAREQLQPSSSHTHDAVPTPQSSRFGPVRVKSETQKKRRAAFESSSPASPSTFSLFTAHRPSPTHGPRPAMNEPHRSPQHVQTPEGSSRSPSKHSPLAPGRAVTYFPSPVVPGEDAQQALKPRIQPLSSCPASSTASATPDSEEDEFAASFMRKRKVSASLV